MIRDLKKISMGWSLRYYGHERRKVLLWCHDNIKCSKDGELPLYGGMAWSWERHPDYLYLTFGRESDIIMFTLRWS